jgi:hypothetical protein
MYEALATISDHVDQTAEPNAQEAQLPLVTLELLA